MKYVIPYSNIPAVYSEIVSCYGPRRRRSRRRRDEEEEEK
jgi:hypothetical protein